MLQKKKGEEKMKIYVWRCEICNAKGATNIAPMANDLIHIPCGEMLKIEVFSDIFLSWQAKK
jgi:hypothetical protein